MPSDTHALRNKGHYIRASDGLHCCPFHYLDPDTGAERTRIFTSKKKSVAFRRRDDFERALAQGLAIGSEKQTLGEFLEYWLAEVVRPNRRPRTHDSYAQVVRLYIAPALGAHKLQALTPDHAQKFFNALARVGGKDGAGLSPRTVQYTRAILRRALNQAMKWGRVGRNVAALTDAPAVRRPRIVPLAPEQGRTLLDAVQGHRLEALYRVAISSGLRQGEALGLRWEDVDLDAGVLRVAVALQRTKAGVALVAPKTEQSRRTLPLPPELVPALRAHRIRQKEEQLRAGPAWKGNDWGLVFTSDVGTPLEPRNVVRHFKALLRQAGLPETTRFHDLRHGCASLLVAQGIHPRVVMEYLGHSQIALTMDTYAHVMPDALRAAAAVIDTTYPASAVVGDEAL